MNTEAVVVQLLLADSALMAAVGGRVFGGWAVQGTPYPFVTVTAGGATFDEQLEEPPSIIDGRVIVSAVDDDYGRMKTILPLAWLAVRNAHGVQSGSMTVHQVARVALSEDDIIDPNSGNFVQQLTLRVVATEDT